MRRLSVIIRWAQCLCVCFLSRVQLCVTPWTAARQAPLSLEFSRQEHWRGQPFPSLRDLSNPEIEPGLLHCRQILYYLRHQGSHIHNGQGKGRVRLARIAERKDDNFNIKRIKTLI